MDLTTRFFFFFFEFVTSDELVASKPQPENQVESDEVEEVICQKLPQACFNIKPIRTVEQLSSSIDRWIHTEKLAPTSKFSKHKKRNTVYLG